jgi:hypothetical protein
MKRKLLSMLAAALLTCGSLFTSCTSNEDSPSTDIITDDVDLKDPLTIEAAEDGEIDITMEVILPEPVYYSVNGGEKQEVSLYDPDDPEAHPYTTIDVKVGDKVQLFSRNTTLSKDRDNNNGFYISFESECYVYGNVMSLISPDDNWKDNKEIKEPYALEMLFCYSNIVTHPTRRLKLPATKLSKGCYMGMFSNSSISIAPELPATKLEEECYCRMFYYCDNLTKAPELPATRLAKGCYYYMFWACRGLTEASELPATKLEEKCYGYMFCWCEALTKAPELPATQLAKDCYCYMFGSCISLTKAPELPATTLAEGCYQYMFDSCAQIAESPELPAATLAPNCYHGMFTQTALATAPDLPATTLAEGCYESMFSYCEALTEAPVLPVTKLEKRCYAYMFSHCSNLTGPIELPAEELPEGCYISMFSRCSKLSSVKCLATTMTGTGKSALGSWLEYAGTDESVAVRTLTHAPGTPWVNSDEYPMEPTDWFVPTGWTLVSL